MGDTRKSIFFNPTSYQMADTVDIWHYEIFVLGPYFIFILKQRLTKPLQTLELHLILHTNIFSINRKDYYNSWNYIKVGYEYCWSTAACQPVRASLETKGKPLALMVFLLMDLSYHSRGGTSQKIGPLETSGKWTWIFCRQDRSSVIQLHLYKDKLVLQLQSWKMSINQIQKKMLTAWHRKPHFPISCHQFCLPSL